MCLTRRIPGCIPLHVPVLQQLVFAHLSNLVGDFFLYEPFFCFSACPFLGIIGSKDYDFLWSFRSSVKLLNT